MNLDRFRNPAGQIVEAVHDGTHYQAFVPAPLPPVLAVDSELNRAISDASYALGVLAATGRTMPNPYLLVRPFLNREAVLSSRIEGTQTGIKELYEYEAREAGAAEADGSSAAADAREVLNYVRALESGLNSLREGYPLGRALILELHKTLLRGVRGKGKHPGEFRILPNCIGHRGCNLTNATFVPPPVLQMNDETSWKRCGPTCNPTIRITFC